MHSVTVKLSDLLSILQTMKTDGIDFVTLQPFEEEDDMPATLWLSGIESADPLTSIDYEDIDIYDPDSL